MNKWNMLSSCVCIIQTGWLEVQHIIITKTEFDSANLDSST